MPDKTDYSELVAKLLVDQRLRSGRIGACGSVFVKEFGELSMQHLRGGEA